MFLGTSKAEINSWESNWPHLSPYWQTPLLLLFKITSKSDLKLSVGFFQVAANSKHLR